MTKNITGVTHATRCVYFVGFRISDMPLTVLTLAFVLLCSSSAATQAYTSTADRLMQTATASHASACSATRTASTRISALRCINPAPSYARSEAATDHLSRVPPWSSTSNLASARLA